MQSELSNIDEQLSKGDLHTIKAWLQQHVWSQGCRYPLQALLQNVSGKPLSAEDFKRHIVARYGQ
jgi:carboxypeptidase Taq